MKTVSLRLLGLLAVLAAFGCNDSNNGDPAASLASCDSYCDAYLGAMCPDYPNADECKSVECGDIPAQPAICQTTIKAYYDCQKTQQDVCGFDACHEALLELLRCE